MVIESKVNVFKKYLHIKWGLYLQLDFIVSSGRGINNEDGLAIQQNYETFKEIVEDMKTLLRRDKEEPERGIFKLP